MIRLQILPISSSSVENRLDQPQEGVGSKGLRDEIDGPEIHGLRKGSRLAEGREEDDRQIPFSPPDLPQELQASHPRHDQVGKDQVKRLSLKDGDGLAAVSDKLDLIPRASEDPPETFPHIVVILDHQDPELG
jgi:hypothetical protein